MMILGILLVVYVCGVVFFAGLGIGQGLHFHWSDLVCLATWPVTVPAARLLHWWQWGKHWHRYSDTPWWSRGERERRSTDPNA